MKGTILDYSIQSNSGVISGDDQIRYPFTGAEWKADVPPNRGIRVDFDVDSMGNALQIYTELKTSNTFQSINHQLDQISNPNKDEEQYNPIDWFVKCIKQYVTFDGRARRKEFWFFALFYLLGAFATMFIDYLFGTEILFYVLYILAMALPQAGVAIRRLHDIGRSGWWYLVSLVPIVGFILLIIWFSKDGDTHNNLYGQPVK